MKRNYIAAAVCILSLAACSKTELDEEVSAPKGEAVTLTVPQTKVALNGEHLAFEGDEIIYAFASNGSTAKLTASDNSGKFTGVFSEPVANGSTISLYCHNEADKKTFVQNGKPWLQSLDNSFSRTGNNEISLTATLAAPKGVRAIAVVTDGTGIESLEFHTKNDAKLSSFDGSTFGGEAVATQPVVTNKAGYTNSTIFNVPEGLEGGYWIKAVKDGQAMYKSYSSNEAVTKDARVVVKEFTPVEIKISYTGLETTYSYYLNKDLANANKVENSMKRNSGSISYSISGISSKLFTFNEFSVTGENVNLSTSDPNTKTLEIPQMTFSSFGDKSLTVKVSYTTIDGIEVKGVIEGMQEPLIASYITGLPYSVNFSSQPSEWSRGRNTSWSDGLKLGGGASGDASATLSSLSVPSDINIGLKLNEIVMVSIKGGVIINRSKLDISIGSNTQKKVLEGPNIDGFKFESKSATYPSLEQSGTISSQNKNIKLQQQQEQAGCYCTIGSLTLNYK